MIMIMIKAVIMNDNDDDGGDDDEVDTKLYLIDNQLFSQIITFVTNQSNKDTYQLYDVCIRN